MSLVAFRYRNHKGVVKTRSVEVKSLDFLKEPGFGYQPGWFLTGICADKNEIRSFALCNIILDGVPSMPNLGERFKL